MRYMEKQIEDELLNNFARYTRDEIDRVLARLKQEYEGHQSENYSLRMQVDALKKENELIWRIYVEKTAELMIEIKKLSNTE